MSVEIELRLDNDYGSLGQSTRSFLDSSHGFQIGGKQVRATSTYALQDPSTGQVFAHAGQARMLDVADAVSAAKQALGGAWSRYRPHQREACLLRLADLLEQHARPLSEIETVCSGRLLQNTLHVDVHYSAHVLRYMAGWATKLSGRTTPLSVPYVPDGELDGFTFREAVGVVAAIVPWNVALGIAIWKIAPALAAGCTIVLKPAPQTPLTALYLAQLALEAGLPEGVLNVVTGSEPEVGVALVRDPDVDMVSFTGSTEVGRQIALDAAGAFKRFSLELGGKSPVIIAQDADLSRAIPQAAWAIFANHGQNCCAGSRLYAHARVFDEVVDGISAIAESITLGAPLDSQSAMGPLVNRAHSQRVLAYVQEGIREGASLRTGGQGLDHPGAYVRPTVLAGVSPQMRVVREEIFGPVLVAASFENDAQAVSLANDSEFGLGASIWSRDLDRVRYMTRKLQAGSVWVNTHNTLDVSLPFGGWKSSGMGHDLSEEAVLAHTRLKSSVHHYLQTDTMDLP
ncbi:MAG: aldehyde dehydrogenase family protein [Alcaligenes faecalis]